MNPIASVPAQSCAPDSPLAAAARGAESQAPFFALERVSFEAAGRVLLHPVDLAFARGSVVGLLGHNGSGKSTLLKLLARQQRPHGGTIRLQGRPLDAWANRALARAIAYLPQHLPGTDGLTVRELVALGRYPWHGALGLFGDDDRATVDEALRATDTAAFADRAADSLSGGERQRAWLAMLVAQRSECLLLDEPISALDIRHQIEVLALVRALAFERSLCVVVVLHDVNLAARYCDRLVALRRGGVVVDGTPTEFMCDAVLTNVYDVRMGTVAHPMGDGRIGFPY
ncbi:ATP-binding cassette domain-containing protein [Burkholderia gladioli]|uniref:ABC transporter related protein n=1 Tax=Burkholderia gladioli (strain BSR3) TaxID=999541 RepID=F2LSU4_BURGS|nr:ATP-binding cassette domain-containing protein [Burkholderia gladioli]AEA65964.1 ABC transporter related protein [Burkholderia gladioli BSR3]MBW5286934.1 ATP-binding cassette domain-containing protein [Burkholderia gladioli]